MAVPGFYAYASRPNSVVEAIRAGIAELNKGNEVKLVSWEDLKVSGNFIIDKIMSQIEASDFVCVDLTGLNPNVLFEFGFAVAKNKKLWISLDTSFESETKQYEDFRLFTTVGYSSFENSRTLVYEFYRDQPYRHLEETLYASALAGHLSGATKPEILYLKSIKNSESSIKLTQFINSSKIQVTTDDPAESAFQTLSWYIHSISSAHSVLAHFESPEIRGSKLHNAKLSFLAGVSLGLGKTLLMLSPQDLVAPIDYRDYAKTYHNVDRCVAIAEQWLNETKETISKTTQRKNFYLGKQAAQETLKLFRLGDHEAEKEEKELAEYFVETAAFHEAVGARTMLFVGKKGTGKSANFIRLADTLSSDRRNFVCQIRPVDYELEGVVELLNTLKKRAERGFMVESLWKFLLYSELALQLRQNLAQRPASVYVSPEELTFIEFFDTHQDMLASSFSMRLEGVVRQLKSQGFYDGSSADGRLKLAEGVHAVIIRDLRAQLGRLLSNRSKVVFLIDNLDKAWTANTNVDITCEFLFGLINVAERIGHDFATSDQWRLHVNVSIILFMRSDIFERILPGIAEPDKIKRVRIEWDEPELLLRVIEERFRAVTQNGLYSPEDLWDTIFPREVDGVPIKKYLTSITFPRPRDLIFLCNAALSSAVNRGHESIDPEDLRKAEVQYSKHALDSLKAELPLNPDQFDNLMFEFLRCTPILDYAFLRQILDNLAWKDRTEDELAAILFEAGFLGVETDEQVFQYNYDEEGRNRTLKLAKRFASQQSRSQRFEINRPLWSYLEVKRPELVA